MPLRYDIESKTEIGKKIQKLAETLPYKEWYLPDPYNPASYIAPIGGMVGKFTKMDKFISVVESLGAKKGGRYGGVALHPFEGGLVRFGLAPEIKSPYIQTVVRNDKVKEVIKKLRELNIPKTEIKIDSTSWNKVGDNLAKVIKILAEE